jgi:hypothetical protein
MAAFGVTEVLGFHLLRSVLLGYLMFAALGAAHFPAEAAAVDPSQLRGDHVLLQTATTVNFKDGAVRAAAVRRGRLSDRASPVPRARAHALPADGPAGWRRSAARTAIRIG